MKKILPICLIMLSAAVICWGTMAFAVDFKAVDKSGHVSNLKEKFDDPAMSGKKGQFKIYK